MPELPEVETIVRELRPLLVGRRLGRVRVSKLRLRKRWLPVWGKLLQGRRFESVNRRGKWIVAELDQTLFLLIHLGMTGQLRVLPSDEARANHTHLIFDLDDGKEQLRFRDIRRFGSATVFTGRDNLEAFFVASGLGPEPFDLDAKFWRDQLAATRRNLKAVLLDQTVVAGVGNIYADEALFEARIHPTTLACDLSKPRAERLREAIVAVLNRAIERRGSSIRNYVGGSGLQGGYQNEFRVYGRFGKPCTVCERPIARIRLAGRATHFCPHCQK